MDRSWFENGSMESGENGQKLTKIFPKYRICMQSADFFCDFYKYICIIQFFFVTLQPIWMQRRYTHTRMHAPAARRKQRR